MVKKISKTLRKIEYIFEIFIWNFRFFILAPVIFSLISALRFIVIGTVDILSGVFLKFDVKDPEGEVTVKIVTYIIGGIDYYLIGIVLFIFAFGIYELFISEINIRHKDNSSILQSHTLEELKSKSNTVCQTARLRR